MKQKNDSKSQEGGITKKERRVRTTQKGGDFSVLLPKIEQEGDDLGPFSSQKQK